MCLRFDPVNFRGILSRAIGHGGLRVPADARLDRSLLFERAAQMARAE